jgi:MinD superfamily P-loop ATPase
MKRIVFASGRGNEGLSALLSSFLTLTPNCVLADCSYSQNRLIRVMHPEKRRSRLVPHIPSFSFDAERCCHCEKCVDICMHDAILRFRDQVTYVEHRCTSCGSCVRWCPLCVLEFTENHEARIYSAPSPLGHIVWSEAFIDPFHRPRMSGLIVEQAGMLASNLQSPYLIIRPGRGFGTDSFRAVRNVDAIVLLTAPSPFALDDLKKMTRFSRLCGHEPIVLLNKDHERCADAVDGIIKYCKEQHLQIGGRIPWEPLFNKAEQQSLSLMEMNEAHKSKSILKEIWFNLQRLIGQQS